LGRHFGLLLTITSGVILVEFKGYIDYQS